MSLHGMSPINSLNNPRTSFPPALIFLPSSPHGSVWQGPSSQCPPCASLKHTEVLTELDRQHNVNSSVLQLYILTSDTSTILKFASRSVLSKPRPLESKILAQVSVRFPHLLFLLFAFTLIVDSLIKLAKCSAFRPYLRMK